MKKGFITDPSLIMCGAPSLSSSYQLAFLVDKCKIMKSSGHIETFLDALGRNNGMLKGDPARALSPYELDHKL